MIVTIVIMSVIFIVALYVICDYLFNVTKKIKSLINIYIKTSDRYIKWENERAAKKLGFDFEAIEVYRIIFDMALVAFHQRNKTATYLMIEDDILSFTKFAEYISPKWGIKTVLQIIADGESCMARRKAQGLNPRFDCKSKNKASNFDGIKDYIKKDRIMIYEVFGGY